MMSAIGTNRPAGHRARILRALGVMPWLRRSVAPVVNSESSTSATTADVGCVVILPEVCTTRELDLLGRALNACGASIARAPRIRARGGELTDDVPEARVYLVFGDAQAHALGRALPSAVMNQAQILLADDPALVLTHAGAKRRLWSALRSLRRALASSGG
ncbi:MAG: hypothetical protein M3Y93_04135 [Pseudomonadota bacterium]|nr:hypothetical protein [Pseudomonadota bacterium]